MNKFLGLTAVSILGVGTVASLITGNSDFLIFACLGVMLAAVTASYVR